MSASADMVRCLICGGACSPFALHCDRCRESDGEEPPQPPIRLGLEKPLTGHHERPVGAAFTLPVPPSINSAYRCVNGRSILSKKAREWKDDADQRVKMQRQGRFVTGFVEVHVTVHFRRRRGDLDNVLKLTLDAVKGEAFGDDDLIERIVLDKRIDTKDPRVEVVIYPFTLEQQEAA